MIQQPTPDAPTYLAFPGSPTVVVRRRGMPFDELPALMDSAFTALRQAIEEGAFVPAGPPFSRHERMPDATVDCEVGFCVESAPHAVPAFAGEELVVSELPAGRIAQAVHVGGYDALGSAWERFIAAVQADGHTIRMPFWEAYHTEPTPDADPATMETGLAVLVDEPTA